MAEERNQVSLKDNEVPDRYAGSEEMLYSGVYRNEKNGAQVPSKKNEGGNNQKGGNVYQKKAV